MEGLAFHVALHQLQLQSVHPAAVWQKIQKYPLPYNQATERLLSSGCETPELNLNTFSFLAWHKGTTAFLLYSPVF